MLTEAELESIQANIGNMDEQELLEVLSALEELEARKIAKARQDDLIEFCKHMDPSYKVGKHHRRLANLLMAMERGDEDRIGVSVPPRHGKSMLVSTFFPAWYLGKNPEKYVMLVSHTADLATDFGRKVRNIVDSELYKEVFPNVKLAVDSKSAGRWNTNAGGSFYACGVGAALAGRGADFLIIDDPFSEQDILNGNYEVFDKTYEWFAYGARTRLMPHGCVAIVHCMTGDTNVLMADGSEKHLAYIRPGDMVATYNCGRITTAKVLNWANQGIDRIYSLRMNSGVIIRGNERHPFLVDTNGVQQWVTLKNLKPGMSLVSVQDAQTPPTQRLKDHIVRAAITKSIYARKLLVGCQRKLSILYTNALQKVAKGHLNQKPDPDYAVHAMHENTTINTTQMLHASLLGITESGKVKPALQMGVNLPPMLTPCAHHAVVKKSTVSVKKQELHTAQRDAATPICELGTASLGTTTTVCFPNRVVSALYAKNPHTKGTPPTNGTHADWRSTIVTKLVKYVPFYATLATLWSNSETTSVYYAKPLHTLSTTLDTIVSITPDGYEDVFDIQVEGTENFIANGVVSHNTRWHPSDLIGQLARDMVRVEGMDKYHFFEFPAIFNEGTPEEVALWPEFYDLDALHRTKASMPLFQWNAQYQQNPTAEEGALVKREWWKKWDRDDPPPCEYIIMTLDAAAEKNNRADFTALLTWGVFSDERLTEGANHIMLLNAINVRVEFHELKELALKEWTQWQPDAFIVEKKSNGTPLFQELRRTGIPVQEFTPHRGTGDKIARLNAVSDIVRSGMVWYPAGRKWAEEVVEQVAAFPASAHDDLVDCVSMALTRFRNGGFIRLDSDEQDAPIYRRTAAYY